VSLISDLVRWWNVLLGESVFYVGVYIGDTSQSALQLIYPAALA